MPIFGKHFHVPLSPGTVATDAIICYISEQTWSEVVVGDCRHGRFMDEMLVGLVGLAGGTKWNG